MHRGKVDWCTTGNQCIGGRCIAGGRPIGPGGYCDAGVDWCTAGHHVLVEGALRETLALVLLLQVELVSRVALVSMFTVVTTAFASGSSSNRVELAADACPPGHLGPWTARTAVAMFMGHAYVTVLMAATSGSVAKDKRGARGCRERAGAWTRSAKNIFHFYCMRRWRLTELNIFRKDFEEN